MNRMNIVAVVALAGAQGLASAQVRFDAIGGLGDAYSGSGANAVSADGRAVVGGTDVPGCRYCGGVPFVWTVEYGLLLLDESLYGGPATGLSTDHAFIVGTIGSIHDSLPPCDEAYIWSAGAIMRFGVYTDANGVSDDGSVIVGGNSVPERWTGATGWREMGPIDGAFVVGGGALGVTPDGGTVVGRAIWQREGEYHIDGFVWTGGSGMRALPKFSVDQIGAAYAVSRGGGAIVGTVGTFNAPRAVRWVGEQTVEYLGQLPNQPPSWARGVSDDGEVIVGMYGGYPQQRVFIWDRRRGIRDLQNELVDEYGLDLSGWTLQSAHGVSANGRVIVGTGRAPLNRVRAWRVDLGWDCAADTTHDGVVDSHDFYAYLSRFFAGHADFNTDGVTNSQDFFDFMTAFFAGC